MAQYIEYVKGKKYPPKDAEISFDLDAFDDAGYLFKPEDLVVDIDELDKETIRDLINRFNIRTEIVWTDRGAHLYFKMPKGFRRNQSICALGFKIEYKYLKGKNKSITIKRNGIVRDIENPGKREELPDFFMPGKYDNLLGVSQGNRNNSLYKLKSKIFTLENSREILKFVNERIFDEPLDDREFEQVAREESFQAEKGLETQTADLIMQQMSPYLYRNKLYLREGDVYISDDNLIDRIIYDYCQGMNTAYQEEVKKQLQKRCPYIPPDKTDFKIKLNNGYLYKGKFYDLITNSFTPYNIEIDYYPDTEPVQVVDDYINQLTGGDKEYREFLLEMIANTLVVDKGLIRSIGKFYIMVGDGGNGKGTFLQIIKKILNPENCSSLSLTDLEDERYIYNLVDKLVNLGDDIENKPITERSGKLLKNLSTADNVMIRKMRHNAEPVEMIATLIFTSNHVIKSFDKSYGLGRRITWLPMFSKPETIDPQFIEKLTTRPALEYWIKLIVEAYTRLYKRGYMPECKILNEYKDDYLIENNNSLLFLQNLDDLDLDHVKPKTIFLEYENWCENNGETPVSRKQLLETIRKEKGFVSKPTTNKGQSVRLFFKVKD